MEYNKAFIDCLGALRRRLKQEQGLEIRFNETGAIPRMLAASQQSNDPETRALAERLALMSGMAPEVRPPASAEALPDSSYVSAEFMAANHRYAGPLRG